MLKYADIHTHNIESDDAVINFDPTVDCFDLIPSKVYSVGIHPWNVDKATYSNIEILKEMANIHNVVAIGECGLDTLKNNDLKSQTELFELHISISEHTNKPLIIHCVKAAHEIIKLHKQFRPKQQWIYHGFRGKPALARQLTDEGIYLSFGKVYNEQSYAYASSINMCYKETD